MKGLVGAFIGVVLFAATGHAGTIYTYSLTIAIDRVPEDAGLRVLSARSH